tara:strand:+ start:120 stop:371 length:252 start_codon:yes stop_codon:yes gene_type:complete
MKTKNYITKVRSQFKSSYYYLFWGAATVGVIAGQIYVGSGYRAMSRSMNRWFEETIDIITMPHSIDPHIYGRPDNNSRMPIIQ